MMWQTKSCDLLFGLRDHGVKIPFVTKRNPSKREQESMSEHLSTTRSVSWTYFGWSLLVLAAACFHCPAYAFSSTYDSSVYFDQSNARDAVDQACYESPKFWKEIEQLLPPSTNSDLERFWEFCQNLRTQQPGATTVLPNRQELLSQYIFPGLDVTPRCAYPSTPALQKLSRRLENDVAPTARRELSKLLKARPLVSDDEAFDGMQENDGDTWQRAAWYGWQFLSLRGAQSFMPKTTRSLTRAFEHMGGPAHRFVGLARQKKDCTGTVHSE